MEQGVHQEIFTWAIAVIAVPIILSLPIFFFVQDTHSFLIEICYAVVDIHCLFRKLVQQLYALVKMLFGEIVRSPVWVYRILVAFARPIASKMQNRMVDGKQTSYDVQDPAASPLPLDADSGIGTFFNSRDDTYDGSQSGDDSGLSDDHGEETELDSKSISGSHPASMGSERNPTTEVSTSAVINSIAFDRVTPAEAVPDEKQCPRLKATVEPKGHKTSAQSHPLVTETLPFHPHENEYLRCEGTLHKERVRHHCTCQQTSVQDEELRRIDFSCLKEDDFDFIVDEKGGFLELPFSTGKFIITFPSNTVSSRTRLRFAAGRELLNQHRTMLRVIPALYCFVHKNGIKKSFSNLPFNESDFTSEGCNFDRPISIKAEIKADLEVQEIKLQVTKSSNNADWRKVEDTGMKIEQNWILFSISSFAGVRVVAWQPLQKLYVAVYLKRPTEITDPVQHHFFAHAYSGSKETRKEAALTLNSDANEVIISRHLVQVRPPCELKIKLSIEGMVSYPTEAIFKVSCRRLDILDEECFAIRKPNPNVCVDRHEPVQLKYKMSFNSKEFTRQCYFYWNAPLPLKQLSFNSIASVGSLTINAVGKNSAGIVFNSSAANSGSEPAHLIRSESEAAFRDHLLPPPNFRTSAPLTNFDSSSENDDDVPFVYESANLRNVPSLTVFSESPQNSSGSIHCSTPIQPIIKGVASLVLPEPPIIDYSAGSRTTFSVGEE